MLGSTFCTFRFCIMLRFVKYVWISYKSELFSLIHCNFFALHFCPVISCPLKPKQILTNKSKNVTTTNCLCLHFLLIPCCLSSALLISVHCYITPYALLTQLTPYWTFLSCSFLLSVSLLYIFKETVTFSFPSTNCNVKLFKLLFCIFLYL